MSIKPHLILPLLCLAGCQDAGAYAEQCSAPLSHWRKQSEGMNHHAIPIHVRLDADGKAKWGGKAVTDTELGAYLDKARPLDPLPFIILSAQSATPCDRVEAIRRLMDQHYCKLRRVCGEGSGNSRDWDQVMDLPPSEELRQLEALADNVAEAAEPPR